MASDHLTRSDPRVAAEADCMGEKVPAMESGLTRPEASDQGRPGWAGRGSELHWHAYRE